MKWITFFSQTGSEIANISRIFGRKPDLIVTNNVLEKEQQYHPELRKLNAIIMSGHHDILMNYFRNQTMYSAEETLITLHGYLRIIPSDICEKYTIYNGHPGSIRMYPDLKGKDPQLRAWHSKDRYPIIGSVVHRVTPGVDEGEIIIEENVSNSAESLEQAFELLKDTSLKAWVRFMQGKLK